MSPSVPLVRLNHARPFAAFLQAVGAPVERLMGEAGLPVEALGDPDALASAHVLYGFVERAAALEGIEDLGTRVGLETAPEDLGELGVPFGPRSSSASLYEALQSSFGHAGRESRRLRLWIETGEHPRLCYRGSLGPGAAGFAIVECYMIGLLVRMVREAAGLDWVPSEIHLQARPAPGPEGFPGLEASRIQTRRSATAITVPWSVLMLPLGCAQSTGAKFAVPSRGELPVDFESGLRSMLRPYLCEGAPSVELAARLAGTSVRTLQRRLSSTGQNFKRLLQELRLYAALELIGPKEVLLADVAAELGYSDPAHFTRAFVRWTGTTPRAYRTRRHAAETNRPRLDAF